MFMFVFVSLVSMTHSLLETFRDFHRSCCIDLVVTVCSFTFEILGGHLGFPAEANDFYTSGEGFRNVCYRSDRALKIGRWG